METFDQACERVIAQLDRNMKDGSYEPFSPEDSELLRRLYRENLELPEKGSKLIKFYTKNKTLIATGYRRVVVGDYGAYIEFERDQLNFDRIQPRWPGEPSRPVRYIWLEVKDGTNTKVYEQRQAVAYADYVPGLYYISPDDLEFDF